MHVKGFEYEIKKKLKYNEIIPNENNNILFNP